MTIEDRTSEWSMIDELIEKCGEKRQNKQMINEIMSQTESEYSIDSTESQNTRDLMSDEQCNKIKVEILVLFSFSLWAHNLYSCNFAVNANSCSSKQRRKNYNFNTRFLCL